MNNPLSKLKNWYQSKCDGSWEHLYGLEIETLDNPGWKVSLSGEENRKIIDIFFERSDNNWLSVKASNNEFIAHGGIDNLDEILQYALMWINDEYHNQTSNSVSIVHT